MPLSPTAKQRGAYPFEKRIPDSPKVTGLKQGVGDLGSHVSLLQGGRGVGRVGLSGERWVGFVTAEGHLYFCRKGRLFAAEFHVQGSVLSD